MVVAEARRRLDVLRRLVRRDFFVTLAMKHFRFPLALKQTFLFLERATILFVNKIFNICGDVCWSCDVYYICPTFALNGVWSDVSTCATCATCDEPWLPPVPTGIAVAVAAPPLLTVSETLKVHLRQDRGWDHNSSVQNRSSWGTDSGECTFESTVFW